MRTLFITVAALALIGAGQSFAQAAPAASAADLEHPTHEMCKSVMGRQMDGKQMHSHSAEKGAPMFGRTAPLTEAEMHKLHATCAAKMAKSAETPKK